VARRASTGKRDYRLGIRAAVRGLWNGAFDLFQFADAMIPTVQRGLTRAADDGLISVGIQPGERTPQEQIALDKRINSEFAHILPFGRDIVAGSKANGGLLRPLLDRAEMWILRYTDVENEARTMAANDPKLEWVWDPAKEHCTSCARLNGKVKRASFWREMGVLPQNPPNAKLECGGWRCGCILRPTDKPVSRGPLPGLP